MKVKLLQITPEHVVNQAIAKPYKSTPSRELTEKVICLKKHLSCAEHVVMSYEISGISRLCLQELVRHRIASYTVQSARFTLSAIVKIYDTNGNFLDKFVFPDVDDDEFISDLKKLFTISAHFISKHKKRGLSNDRLKYFLCEAFKTHLVLTINLRSFLNFISLRTDKGAHFEIRKLANMMIDVIMESDDTEYVKRIINEHRKDR